MSKPRIYTCGPIANTDYDTCAMGWRKDVYDALKDIADVYSPMRGKGFLKDAGVIEALKAYEFNPLSSDRGIVGRDTYDVKNCDLMFTNFVGCPPKASIGSSSEYGLAYAWQKPIITCMDDGNIHDHPFIRGMSTYIVKSVTHGIALARVLLTPGL